MYIVVLNLPFAHELQNYTTDLQVKLYQVRRKLNIQGNWDAVSKSCSLQAGCALFGGDFEYVHNMLAGLSLKFAETITRFYLFYY